MLKGFRDFIMRGNVVDLAVGVVIGVAFNTLITQFTASFLTPLITALGGGGIKAGQGHINGVLVDWGAFINALISFVLTAAVIYFLVIVPMNWLAARRAAGEEPEPPAPSEEVQLLTEIRDALVARERTDPPPVTSP